MSRIVAALLAVAVMGAPFAVAQHSEGSVNWSSLKFLTGKWVGEGSAEGQAGAGTCSFEPGLQGKVLVRKNHSEYPAAADRPAMTHDDLMIIYPDEVRHELRAFYTDNEGHVIQYTITAAGDRKSAVFLGDVEQSTPRFRLTYTLVQPEHVALKFEMAPPGKPDEFKKIIEGRLKKASETN